MFSPVTGILFNTLAFTFICFELWLFGNGEPKQLPGFLLFGLAVGVILTRL
jgi:hypothetical protein